MPKKAISPRLPLNRERILHAAVEVTDRDGLDALTMRRLGAELRVEAMSLYKHIANKEEVLDGMVELVVRSIAIPDESEPWRDAMRRRARSAREVLSKHSWAIGLLESRGSKGPSTLRYLNAILGNLRSAGFTIEHAAHAFWLLDSYVYGQVIQETSICVANPTPPESSTEEESRQNDYPHLEAMYEHAQTHGYSFDGEFEFGLSLILDGLERGRPT